MQPALFLDRDGVINIDHAYVYKQEDFQFVDGIFELCQTAKTLGYLLFVVTNQAGIGRGFYSEQDFNHLNAWMCQVFNDYHASIDKVYFCPHHPEYGIGQYRIDSPMRKPNPGMILAAQHEFNVNLATSLLIGDKESDIEAGINAGVGCNLLLRPKNQAPLSTQANTVIQHLTEALPYLANPKSR